jgi:hypothetical protein
MVINYSREVLISVSANSSSLVDGRQRPASLLDGAVRGLVALFGYFTKTRAVPKPVIKIWLQSAVVALLVALAGCETAPPVQEMSDARQAIAVAREAGAADVAADTLQEAETYLSSAERRLTDKDYLRARRDALDAKSKALSALKAAEKSKSVD